jgi:hypothetical protein
LYRRHQLPQCGAKIGPAGEFDLLVSNHLQRRVCCRQAGSTVRRHWQA